MYTIFRALLLAAHLFYALFVAFRNFARIAHRKCIELVCGDNTRTEVEILVRAAGNMKKLPQHLVIVFGRKEDTVLDCVRIIGWCVTIGIPYISFFDSSGTLIRNERKLKDEVAKRKPDIAGYITWGKPSTTPSKNGFIGSKPKTHVWLLSYADGKGEIVSLTQELATAVITGSIKVEEINDDLLNEKLSLRGIPDPDLALIDGHVCSTYGLLPWHTRTTEFLMLPPYRCLSPIDFVDLLEKYNKSEQRYGK